MIQRVISDETTYLAQYVEEDGKFYEVGRMILSVSAMAQIHERYEEICFKNDIEQYNENHGFTDEEIEEIRTIYEKCRDNDDNWNYDLEFAVKEFIRRKEERKYE